MRKTLSILYFVGAVPSQQAKTRVRPGHLDSSSLFLPRQCLQSLIPSSPTLRSTRSELESPGDMIRDAGEQLVDFQEQRNTEDSSSNGFTNCRHRKTNLK